MKDLTALLQIAEQLQQDVQAELEKIVELKGLFAWDDDLDQMRQDRIVSLKPCMKGLL